MDKQLQKLIKRLHNTRLLDDVAREIFKFGKPGYYYLWTAIDDPSLTDYQVTNLLRALFQMKYHDIDLFVNKLLSFTQDKRIEVRSTATFLAICLYRISERFKELNIPLRQENLEQYLYKALDLGLDEAIVEQVQDVLKVS
ncbi:hypothetical protein RIVM261_029420 [Rivularia sp. IAM M-261]|nr:hypothetical protein RIVM261_029420 [Rivularia sp. IAM M-261]